MTTPEPITIYYVNARDRGTSWHNKDESTFYASPDVPAAIVASYQLDEAAKMHAEHMQRVRSWEDRRDEWEILRAAGRREGDFRAAPVEIPFDPSKHSDYDLGTAELYA